jgi:hypothetical protein
VKPCGQNLFCCYGLGGCDCNNATQVFSLAPVRIVTSLASLPASTSSATSLATTSSPVSTSGTSSPVSTSGASSPLSTSGTSSQPLSTTAASDNTTLPGSGANNLGIGLGVGLGVGIPLLIAVLGGLWWMIMKGGDKTTSAQGAGRSQQSRDTVEKHEPDAQWKYKYDGSQWTMTDQGYNSEVNSPQSSQHRYPQEMLAQGRDVEVYEAA